MQAAKLSELKKELGHREKKELIEVILRLGKLKTENKQMLAYLLVYNDDPLLYAEDVKKEMDELFSDISAHYYYSTKTLRKILRVAGRYRRFTASDRGETEVLLHFIRKYTEVIDSRTSYKPSLALATRVLTKLHKLIQQLEEDLQYDYSREYNTAVSGLRSKLSFWDKLNTDIPKFNI
jgi:hypothetical protein